MNPLKGIHHVTAITSSAEKNYAFFTKILGMRLVKKTVNQDDIQTYHLFFADDRGNPGTDMTFFDFPGSVKKVDGTDRIARSSFRVPSDEALGYWVRRFDRYGVKHEGIRVRFGRKMLCFVDFDDQAYALVSDEHVKGVAPGTPWLKGPVPNEYGIYGLVPIHFEVRDVSQMEATLTKVMGMRKVASEDDSVLYEMGEGGNGASVIVTKKEGPSAIQGYGAVHHVAFRIEDKDELNEWIKRLNSFKAGHSGFVDRFYFQSLYTRLHRGILFEFATEGPGFIDDEEPYETLGEILALPPKFRSMRKQIEALVRPIDTVRSTKKCPKEYEL
jgi:glyoxalase family protein